MTIDPRWGAYFSIGAAIISVLMLCGAEFTTLFGTIATNKILAGLGIFNAIANGINGVLHMIPAQSTLAPDQASKFALGPKAVVGMVAQILLVAFVLSFFLAANPALAQGILKPLKPIIPHATVAASPATAPAAGSSVVSTIDALMQKIDTIASQVVADTVSDINAADADAGTVITPATATAPAIVKDAISHACYPAAVTFLQSLPVATPLTGKLFGVQLFQRKRDFLNQLKAGLPDYLKIGCGALLGDEVKIFTSLMGLVGVTVATGGIGGLFPAAAALPALTL